MAEEAEAYFGAITNGDVDRLRKLVQERPGLLGVRTAPSYAPDGQLECTGLHTAVYARQPEVARVLVDAGIDIEARTQEGRTALHDSIEFGLTEVTDLLLDRGGRLDICSAAILGRVDRVRELLAADPALANDRSTGLSPLGWASFGNQVGTARELIEHGARLDDGELLCAASVGHVEVGRFLIENGADPNEIIGDAGGSAIHAAASMRYSHDSRLFLEMLLDAGADIDLRTSDGRTALRIAENGARSQEREVKNNPEAHRKNFEDVAALLRQRGARGD